MVEQMDLETFVKRARRIAKAPLEEALGWIVAETEPQVLTQAMDISGYDRKAAIEARVRELWAGKAPDLPNGAPSSRPQTPGDGADSTAEAAEVAEGPDSDRRCYIWPDPPRDSATSAVKRLLSELAAHGEQLDSLQQLAVYQAALDLVDGRMTRSELMHLLGADLAGEIVAQAGHIRAYRAREKGIAEQITREAPDLRPQTPDAELAPGAGSRNPEACSLPLDRTRGKQPEAPADVPVLRLGVGGQYVQDITEAEL